MATTNELLAALDVAFETATKTEAALSQVTTAANAAIAAKRAELDRVESDQTRRITEAQAAYDQARAELVRLGDAVRERIGEKNPRVTVR